MTMRRTTAALVAAALTVAACGGDDDAEPAADEPAADEPAEESSTDDDSTDEPAEDTPADEPASGEDEPANEPDDGDTIVARSIADVPERCRDQMAEFMREIEPIVGEIDWTTATIADVQQLGAEIEAASETFEAESAEIGCDDIEFPDDNEFELLIEFAESEAPGVAGYFRFLDELGVGGMGDDDEGDAGALPPMGDSFSNCTEAIEFVQGLIDTYDTVVDVPAADVMAISGLASVITTCTPEQFEFFNSPEVLDFVGGL